MAVVFEAEFAHKVGDGGGFLKGVGARLDQPAGFVAFAADNAARDGRGVEDGHAATGADQVAGGGQTGETGAEDGDGEPGRRFGLMAHGKNGLTLWGGPCAPWSDQRKVVTVSTRACMHSILASGVMPWPRLKI